MGGYRRNVLALVLLAVVSLSPFHAQEPASSKKGVGLGGEAESVVQVGNLIYSGVRSSQCFSDHFLVRAEKESSIATSRRFHTVKLESPDLFQFPFVVMTGEGAFTLRENERENLRKFLSRGGFLLASAGCSSVDWGRSFRREMTLLFPEQKLQTIPMEHAVFHTVFDISQIQVSHGQPKPLEGIYFQGRLGVLFSQDGLNDTAHTQGCCCCGGNQISNAAELNVNILAYALLY